MDICTGDEASDDRRSRSTEGPCLRGLGSRGAAEGYIVNLKGKKTLYLLFDVGCESYWQVFPDTRHGYQPLSDALIDLFLLESYLEPTSHNS